MTELLMFGNATPATPWTYNTTLKQIKDLYEEVDFWDIVTFMLQQKISIS